MSASAAIGHGWREEALCAQVGGDFWFVPERGGVPRETRKAREFCARCPVAASCLAEAWARGEHYGIWGGFNLAYPRDRKRAALAVAELSGRAVAG